jgi:hypothetical protein
VGVASIAILLAAACTPGHNHRAAAKTHAPASHSSAAGTSYPAAPASLVQLTSKTSCVPRLFANPTRKQFAEFRPVAAVWCVGGGLPYPGDGVWDTVTKRATTTGLDGLVSMFRQPDQPLTHAGCSFESVVVTPLVFLVDAHGRAIKPVYPRDGCGRPMMGHSIQTTQWTVVSTVKLRQLQSQLSVTSGCEMGWKNTLAIPGRDRVMSAPAEALGSGDAGPITVCEYENAPSDPYSGHLLAGGRLTGEAAGALRRGLGGAGVAGTCAPQTRFVVVQRAGTGGQWVTAELGGCWRVQRDDPPAAGNGRADPKAIMSMVKTLATH